MIGESWKPKYEEVDIGGSYSGPTLYEEASKLRASREMVSEKEILEELAEEAAESGDEGMFDEYHRRLNGIAK
jgi:hypothetical protein